MVLQQRKKDRAQSLKSLLSLSLSLFLFWTIIPTQTLLILWHFLVVPLDFPSALPVRILPPAPSDDAKREPDERLFRHVHVLRHAVVHRLTHSSSSSSSSSLLDSHFCVCVCVRQTKLLQKRKLSLDDGPTTTTQKKKKKKKTRSKPYIIETLF